MSNATPPPDLPPSGTGPDGSGDSPAPASPAAVAPAPRGLWPLSKPQAFCLHLTLSLLVFSTLVFVMVRSWFPGALFSIDGGWQGLKLVAMVDLVLGPALTLLLYKPGKPKLALDMGLIAALQIVALGYGFVATHQQRTVAVVYADGAFNTLSAQAAAEAGARLAALGAEPRAIDSIATEIAPRVGPPLLLTPKPGPGELGQHLEELFSGWPAPHERSDKYVAVGPMPASGPVRDAAPGAVAGAGPEIGAALPATDPASAARTLADAALAPGDLEDAALRDAVEDALDDAGLAPELVQLHRFRARYANGIAIYDPVSTRILDWVIAEPAAGDSTDEASIEPLRAPTV